MITSCTMINFRKVIFTLLILLNSTLLFGAVETTLEELNLSIHNIEKIKYDESDRFFILVKSISTNDKSLFPNIGKLILHTEGESGFFRIKGTLIITPDEEKSLIYYSLKELNNGRELDVLYASRFGLSICVLKMKLFNENTKVKNDSGGKILVRILKNGMFSTYRNYEFKLSFENDEWFNQVKAKRGYISFDTMFLKAYKFGVKKVYFD